MKRFGFALLLAVVVVSGGWLWKRCTAWTADPVATSPVNRAEWFLRAQLAGTAPIQIDAVCDDATVPAGSQHMQADYATCFIAEGSAHAPVGIEWCEAPADRAPSCHGLVDFRQRNGAGPATPAIAVPPPSAPSGSNAGSSLAPVPAPAAAASAASPAPLAPVLPPMLPHRRQ